MRHSPHIAVSAIIVAVTLMLSSCKFGHEESLDFTDLKTAKGLTFKVLSQHETDLCEKLPAACYLPDGSLLEDYTGTIGVVPDGMRKTSSTTTANILQQLLKFGNKKKVYEIVGTYPSIDENGKHVVLSGKVMLPKGQKPKRMIIVSHYTLGSNAEAPSNSFSLEGILTKLGYGIILPDYLGYGVTADRTHPYLVMQITAQNVLDMYFAVKPWLKAVGMEPEHNDVYLMGYSQGGATTMAVQYMAEMYYTEDEIDIHRVFVGGGPYDIKATYERFVNSDTAGYPVAVPLVIQGMILGNHLDLEMVDIIQPWLYRHGRLDQQQEVHDRTNQLNDRYYGDT